MEPAGRTIARRSRFSSIATEHDRAQGDAAQDAPHAQSGAPVASLAGCEPHSNEGSVAAQRAAALNARISAALSAAASSDANAPMVRKRSRFSDVSERGDGTSSSVAPKHEPSGVKRPRVEVGELRISKETEVIKASAPARTLPTAKQATFSVLSNDYGERDSMRELEAIPVGPVATLQVNRMRERERRLNKLFQTGERERFHEHDETNPFFDPELRGARARKRDIGKRIEFQTQGTFATQGEQLREQHRVQSLFDRAKQDELDRAKLCPPLALLKDPVFNKPPAVEWWDAEFVEDADKFAQDEFDLDANIQAKDVISSLVHIPVTVNFQGPNAQEIVMPLMLTKAESKRMRRMRRLAAEQKRQDEIQMGLADPPRPKVKLSNLMRVLAVQQTQDPTKVEAQVRRDIEERQRRHLAANEAKKPTKEEVWQRMSEKMERDREAGIHIAVFRVLGGMHVMHKAKIEASAKDLHLTGVTFAGPDSSMIVVEGGVKAVRKFIHLMLERISWDNKETCDDHDAFGAVPIGAGTAGISAGEQVSTPCSLSWQGRVAQSTFDDFETLSQPPEHARSFFRKHELLHLWDSCMNLA
ncbi:U4/U6 small nuclear ribonucleoprotein Prp3 [Porphyridium purpureum]|uniref:U4/U6 small nuclear ribonucleoprotein Prp3 n=1 Tax=Porphyridium purpureum TaxID=35688 RepID=A0A5J4YWU7_PORPP|nr:U4/U6 small nuclear ribonucleoprotein Prp3 [Porphyridium purpureum]|eukprot:POR6232..scf209_3